jgi:integrase/recombinase XerD
MKKTFRPCRNEEHRLFVEHLMAKKFSWRTQRLSSYCLDDFGEYLKGLRINHYSQVTKQVLLDYLRELKEHRHYKDTSIEIFFRPVKLFFDYLEEQQKIFINPAKEITLRIPRRLPVVVTEEEIGKMLNSPDIGSPKGVRDRAFMEVLYSTGMRREEIIQLNLADINHQDLTVRVIGKGSKERVLPIGKTAMHWLNEYINKARVELLEGSENKALWIRKGGGRINYESVQAIINIYKAKSGITRKLTCHDFRRAFATHMLRHGASPIDVQLLLGHADLHHLRNYLQLTIADLKKIHEESRVGQ